MLRAHRVASDYIRPGGSGEMPALHALTQKPLDPGRTDAWKGILSPAHSKLVEQIAGKRMVTLGYEPAHQSYSPAQLRTLYFLPRLAVWQSSRVVMNHVKLPYWALRRAVDSRNGGKASEGAPNGGVPPANSGSSVKQKRMA
jgi:hypothetical protein